MVEPEKRLANAIADVIENLVLPQPNGPPVEVGDGRTVELRVCKCCKDPKPRYFVRREGKVVRMAHDIESALGPPKPRPRYDVTPEPKPERQAPRREPRLRSTPSVQGELLPGETKFGI